MNVIFQILVVGLLYFFFFLAPGFLLINLLKGYKDKDFFSTIPVSFVFSLIIFFPISQLAYFLKLPLESVAFLYASSIIVLLFLGRKKITLPKIKFDLANNLIWITILIIALWMIFVPAFLPGDASFHLGQIRKIIDLNRFVTDEAFFPTGLVTPAYGYNSWYGAIAVITKLSGLDLVLIWDRLAVFLVPTSVLGIYTLSKSFFNQKVAHLFFITSYLFWLGVMNGFWEFRLASYPDQVVRHIIVFIAIYFLLLYVKDRSRTLFWLALLSTIITVAVHLYGWIFLLLATVGYVLLAAVLYKEMDWGLIRLLVGSVFIPAFYLLFKLINSSSIVGKTPTIFKSESVLTFSKYLYIINPKQLLNFTDVLLPGLLLILVWFKLGKNLAKKNQWLIFLSGAFLMSIFTRFVPFIAPVITPIISFTYVRRLSYLIMIEAILAAALYFIASSILTENRLKKFIYLVYVVVLALFLVAPFLEVGTRGKDLRLNLAAERQTTPKVFDFVRQNVKKGETIASDFRTSYSLPAYTFNYVVMTPVNNASPTINKNERSRDLKIIMDEKYPVDQTTRVLNKYDVSYILVKKTKTQNFSDKSYTKFESNPLLFEKIYEDKTYQLYLYKEKEN